MPINAVSAPAPQSVTFTPTLLNGGVPVTLLAAAVGEATIDRAGKRCHFNIYVQVTTKGGAAGDFMSIGGLPVAAKTKTDQRNAVLVEHNGLTLAAGWVKGYIDSAQSVIYLQINTFGAPTGNANMTNAAIRDVDTIFFVSGSYPID